MEKQRTHLTPEEVQEFINLGVDFWETHQYWTIGDNGYCSKDPSYLDVIEEAISKRNPFAPDVIYSAVPAPNLQEVLEVLPKQVKAKGGIYQTLRIECYSSIEDWSAGYGIEIDFTELNILDACTDLLRWVCRNHPETLKQE